MPSNDQRMLLFLLPGEIAPAPSCLVPEEVEASKGLEILQERWQQRCAGTTVGKWWRTVTCGNLLSDYNHYGFCGEGSIT